MSNSAPRTMPTSIPGLASLSAETLGLPEVCVAVLDGPVDLSHPCFDGADLSLVETLVNGVAGAAFRGHGTHVASVIFGQPGSPVVGVAPRCRGLIAPVYGAGPDGELVPCTQLDLARAIDQAISLGAHVINISGGELSSSAAPHQLLEKALRRCADSNVLVVAAAGNEGCACLNVPAAFESVLAVGAVDGRGRPLGFSNWGAAYKGHGLMAPGKGVLGAAPGGKVIRRTGTSFATPLVTGVAALLLSATRIHGKALDPRAVGAALVRSALPCDSSAVANCQRMLEGRLNVSGARSILLDEGAVHPSENMSASAGARDAQTVKERTMSDEIDISDVTEPDDSDNDAAAAMVVSASGVEPAALKLAPADNAAGKARGPAKVVPAGKVRAAECGCTSEAAGTLVYSIGELYYDFGTEARLDYFTQQLGGKDANPMDPLKMASHLRKHEADSNALIWTLNIDATPIYALKPRDQFAVLSYVRLINFLVEQESEKEEERAERVAIGGYINGSTRLYNGTVVPTIEPVLRGMYNWRTDALVAAVLAGSTKDPKGVKDQSQRVRTFLERVYYELRNLGTTPQDRALNYAASNAYQVKEVYDDAIREQLVLDTIAVERSPICRPESDCWDVKLSFFDPTKIHERARKIYRYTVDVSDVIPVTVGGLRTWYVY